MNVASTFQRTAGAVSRDTPRSLRVGSIIALVLAVLWLTWFFGASVQLYTTSERARIETIATRSVEAPVAGQVRGVYAALGKSVHAGDVLIELDTTEEVLARKAHEMRGQSASSEARRLQQQIAAEGDALAQWRAISHAQHEESMARYEEAEAAASLAEQDAARADRLFRNGLMSATESGRAASEAVGRRAAARTLAAAAKRSEAEQRMGYSMKISALEKLRAENDEVLSRLGSADIDERLSAQGIEKRAIRAPLTGRIASDIAVRPGSIVKEGELLTSIVPNGGVQIIAEFRPTVALGRLRAGQSARLRLDAFSPVEYGWVHARVGRVATETTGGTIRVELDLSQLHTPLPLEHGMTGIVEVETERLSPAALTLRAVGKRLAGSD